MQIRIFANTLFGGIGDIFKCTFLGVKLFANMKVKIFSNILFAG